MKLDTSMYKELATMGADYVAKGFSVWADEMKRKFGQEISPHLIKIWDVSKEISKKVEESENSRNYNLNKREEVKIKTLNGDGSEIKVLNTLSKLTFKGKILDLIFFVGGIFIFMISLTGGFYSYGGGDPLGIGFSSSGRSGFKVWSVIGMAIGISMIVFGFLRRNWNKLEKGNK